MRSTIVALLLSFTLVSCWQEKKDAPLTPIERKDNSSEALLQEIDRLRIIAAEKDSLTRTAMETSQFINEVYRELLGAQASGASAEVKQKIQERIAEIKANVKKLEKRIGASKQTISELKNSNTEMIGQIEDYQKTIDNLRLQLDDQQLQLSTLNEKVASLEGENLNLKSNVENLSGQVGTLTTQRDTKFYIIGTTDELVEKGIIEKKGRTLGLGGAWVPTADVESKKHLFTQIDKYDVIPFPKEYEIVRPHDVKKLEAASSSQSSIRNPSTKEREEVGKAISGMKAKDPDQFWAPSPLLIIIRE